MRSAGYPGGKYTGKATIEIVGNDNGNGLAVIQIVERAFTSLGFHTRVDEGGQCGMPEREIEACPSVGWIRDFADPQSVLYEPFYGPQISVPYSANWGQVNDQRTNSAIAHTALAKGPAARV